MPRTAGRIPDILPADLSSHSQICTDILYQPLTLLDCLHTFCGSCLREWFAWQAQSAVQARRTTLPYTCPSCRESVRGTKGGWMLSTMLEGYLRAHPDKAKSDAEKEDIAKHYKPGDEVLLPVRVQVVEEDSEDERLLRQVQEISMADADPEVARRRRAEREARHRRRREEERRSPEELSRRQQPSRWASQQVQLTEARLRQHDPQGAQIEHQPSLRSLLSASEADPQDVQAEILQSIYQEGMLEGIDLDNLTTAQEEELTERIADAYRRRQRERRRERSRNREHRSSNERSPRPGTSSSDGAHNRSPPQSAATTSQEPRARPPIARPHLFQQSLDAPRSHARSQSSTSARSNRSNGRNEQQAAGSPASRSATDLSLQPRSYEGQRPERRRLSNTGRSVTDPHDDVSREQIRRVRTRSNETRPQSESRADANSAARASGRPVNSSTTSLPATARPNNITAPATTAMVASPLSSPTVNPTAQAEHAVRPAISRAAFAPETVPDAEIAPSVKCNRCERPSIQHELHYNCPVCLEGAFNLCLSCYRQGQGCHHWFGFGFRAYERFYRSTPPEGWPAGFDRPHILTPRRYKTPDASADPPAAVEVQEGAFCEMCFEHANDSYWYCNICLEGAWGYCADCTKRGRHCTHALMPISHISQQHHHDPSKVAFVGLPHLRQDSYVVLPVLTDCDICSRPIPPNSTRFHCYECNDGDYDICSDCYRSLVAQGKISTANGTNGWRRCLQGHRMAVVGYQDTMEGGHLRIVVRDRVGGSAFREDDISMSGQQPPGGYPPDGGVGMRCLALYCYWPAEGVEDELAFPKNAEVREVEDRNGDWYWGVYAGKGALFPSNHVRRLG